MVAHNEARCPSCGRSHSWSGKIEDRPACPYCGYRLPEADRKKAQEKFDEMVEKTKTKKVAKRKSKGQRKSIRRKKASKRKGD